MSGAKPPANNHLSFHNRYLDICRLRNIKILPEVRGKDNNSKVLDAFGDKFSFADWLLIIDALYHDTVLQTLSIKLRKCISSVDDHIDTEKKAKRVRKKPVIYTKYIFTGLVNAVSNCIKINKDLQILKLEALPFNEKFIDTVMKALNTNSCVKELSFERSTIGDSGCEIICNTMRYLTCVEKLNLSDCRLTKKGAELVAEMIKFQKISRFSEGWQNSLRYRNFDHENVQGLRWIALAHNANIGDEGLKMIFETLKEDVWIKYLDMSDCGLTNDSEQIITNCVKVNKYLLQLNVKDNPAMSKETYQKIQSHFNEDEKSSMSHLQDDTKAYTKVTSIKDQVERLVELLAIETNLRKKAEKVNAKLVNQVQAYETQLKMEAETAAKSLVLRKNGRIPDGYVVINEDSLKSIIKERNDLRKAAESVDPSLIHTPRLMLTEHGVERHVLKINPTIEAIQQLPYESVQKSNGLRKAKSEMKYVELPLKEKQSLSDYELMKVGNYQPISIKEIDINIGDTAANDKKNQLTMEEIYINTSRSINTSEFTDDEITLRNYADDEQTLRHPRKHSINDYSVSIDKLQPLYDYDDSDEECDSAVTLHN